MAPEEEALTRELIDVNTAIVARHARTIRVRAAASTVLALLLLYSAAAALSRDRHGRTATLTAAWLGIAFQLGEPAGGDPDRRGLRRHQRADPRADVDRVGPARAARPTGTPAGPDAPPGRRRRVGDGGAASRRRLATASGEPPPRPEAVAGFMQTAFHRRSRSPQRPWGFSVSLLLITYFGGRRGRALYGLAAAAAPAAQVKPPRPPSLR